MIFRVSCEMLWMAFSALARALQALPKQGSAKSLEAVRRIVAPRNCLWGRFESRQGSAKRLREVHRKLQEMPLGTI